MEAATRAFLVAPQSANRPQPLVLVETCEHEQTGIGRMCVTETIWLAILQPHATYTVNRCQQLTVEGDCDASHLHLLTRLSV